MAFLVDFHHPAPAASARRFPRRLPAALAAFAFFCFTLHAGGQVSREYQLKAVFLYNFAQFTEWPPDAFQDPQAPIIIGIFGKDPFGESLDEAVRGEKVGGRPLVIRRFTRLEDVQTCHILFLTDSQSKRLPAILAAVKGRGILTVSDMENFVPQGGMVRFLTRNNRIQLRINMDAVKAARLTISSKILRSAEIVSSDGT